MVCAIFQKALALWCAPCVRFLGEEYPQRPAALPPSLKDGAKVQLICGRLIFLFAEKIYIFFLLLRNKHPYIIPIFCPGRGIGRHRIYHCRNFGSLAQ